MRYTTYRLWSSSVWTETALIVSPKPFQVSSLTVWRAINKNLLIVKRVANLYTDTILIHFISILRQMGVAYCVNLYPSSMTSLQVLSMKFNSLTSLEDDLVLGFTNLNKLDLRENPLEHRPHHWKVKKYKKNKKK